jgi:3',5'-cyclic AMP phosphodiesterase CpdA
MDRVPLKTWFSKRAIGGLNLLLGRSRRFADAKKKMAALGRFKNENNVDLVLCTGDYTALGLDHEYEEVVKTVRALMDAPLGYVHVPGNHDYYLKDALRENRFARYFAGTLKSDMPQYQVDGEWPLVRLIGKDLAVIAINSSRPNPQPWRSNGEISDAQIEVLSAIANDEQVKGRYALVITHFAPLLKDGLPDKKMHGLVNARQFLNACAYFQYASILCGHVHKGYHTRDAGTELSIFCAGSATMEDKESFWLLEFEKGEIHAAKGKWCGKDYRLSEWQHFHPI